MKIKALTLMQPYAHLVVTPQSELHEFDVQKRIENRPHNMRYRGALLIHAGKSKSWLRSEHRSGMSDEEMYPDMAWGAIVGMAWVIACYGTDEIARGQLPRKHGWVKFHPHTQGPYCIVLDGASRFKEPIPWTGKQGLFNINMCVVEEAIKEALLK